MREMPLLLCVGGADTGRAPMMAALLGRRLAEAGHHARVESAGVLGHDGAPAEVEARDAMAALGLDISAHRARSLGPELVSEAALLLTPDRGTTLALRARLEGGLAASSQLASLAELAGYQRDIPDPFRMQVGAWLTYAREIDTLLYAALPRIIALAGLGGDGALHPFAEGPRAGGGGAALERLLAALAEFPELFDWPRTRSRIEQELAQTAREGIGPAYAALIRALLALTPATPTPGQLAALREAGARLQRGPTPEELGALSGLVARWPTL
jgi:protein-tyrosine phosphatase